MSARTLVAVVSYSRRVTFHDAGAITRACNAQVRDHIAPAWGWRPVPVSFFGAPSMVPAGAWTIAILDDPDQANALGYHADGPDGRPYGRVFTSPTLDAGGSVMRGPDSVSCTLSHEVAEVLGDPEVNRWAQGPDGQLWALELADQVEGDVYDVPVVGTGPVAVSNFLTPAGFDAHPPVGARFDYLGRLGAPFTMTAGGYAIVMRGGRATQVFASAEAEARFAARRVAKAHPAARTARRGVFAAPHVDGGDVPPTAPTGGARRKGSRS